MKTINKIKYFLIILLSILFVNKAYSKISINSVYVGIGGGVSSLLQIYNARLENELLDNHLQLFGVAAVFELGYRFYYILEDNVVHSVDLMSEFSFEYLYGPILYNEAGTANQKTIRYMAGAIISYSVGYKFNYERIMFDIVGLGFLLGQTISERHASWAHYIILPVLSSGQISTVKIGVQYLFPGFSYIANNGFTLSLRTKFKFNLQPNGKLDGFIDISTIIMFGITIQDKQHNRLKKITKIKRIKRGEY